MRYRAALAAAAILSFAALPAIAQTQAPAAPLAAVSDPNMDKLTKYVDTEAYYKAVSAVVEGAEHDINPGCQAKVISRAALDVDTIPHFAEGKDSPDAGAWKDQFTVDRCGFPVLDNLWVQVEKDGSPHMGFLVSGETQAPLGLQYAKDGVLQAVAKSALKAGACSDPKTFLPLDTRIHKVQGKLSFDAHKKLVNSKWDEMWMSRACDKVRPTLVSFVADGQGKLSFTARPATAKEEAEMANKMKLDTKGGEAPKAK